MFWFNSYLDADIDSYKSLNFVGVPNAFALMLLIWIIFFTFAHGEEETSLGNVISGAAMTAMMGGETDQLTSVVSGMEQSGMSDEF